MSAKCLGRCIAALQYLLYHVSRRSRAQIFFTVQTAFLFAMVFITKMENIKKKTKEKKKKNPITASISLLLVFSVQCNEKCLFAED